MKKIKKIEEKILRIVFALMMVVVLLAGIAPVEVHASNLTDEECVANAKQLILEYDGDSFNNEYTLAKLEELFIKKFEKNGCSGVQLQLTGEKIRATKEASGSIACTAVLTCGEITETVEITVTLKKLCEEHPLIIYCNGSEMEINCYNGYYGSNCTYDIDLVITAEDQTLINGAAYTGASLNEEAVNKLELFEISVPEIKYYRDEACTQEITSFTQSGTYYAAIKCINMDDIVKVAKDTFTITVLTYVAPAIESQPQDVSVIEGETATFTVAATGDDLQYQWKLNGVDISGATSASYTTEATTAADDGNKYQCVVTNVGGSVTSEVAVLTVETIPDNGASDDGDIEKDVEVSTDAPIDEATLNNSKEELLNANNIFDANEKQQIDNGADARVWLAINNIPNVASADKDKIEKAAAQIMGDKLNIIYFDLKLFKQVGTDVAKPISEPGLGIKITFKMPTELINSNATVKRVYQVIRLHAGQSQADVLNGTFDAATGEFTFVTDKFSTYAIVYKDVPVVNEENTTTNNIVAKSDDNQKDAVPKTGDNYVSLYAFLLMVFSGLGAIACLKKRK